MLGQNLGQLKLPLSERQAQNLIKVCYPSSYGQHLTRILDIFVRDSFELEPHQFKIKNLDWQIKINMLAKRAFYHMKPSGTEDLEIYAELHKMILYKKNGHFMRHKDNVLKDKHMFGTLVVQLPSEYTGGEFITLMV